MNHAVLPTRLLSYLSCNPKAALAHHFGSFWLSRDESAPRCSLFCRIPGWGICRLANGGCSVLPNVNGIKCDHFADKCKQVSFWLAVEIIPQFCNLETIDFVDVDYSISSFFQWYSDSFNCSFQVMCVWCFLISTLMIDRMNSMSVLHHLTTTNEFVSTVATDTFTACFEKFLFSFPKLQKTQRSLRRCHTFVCYFTAQCNSWRKWLSVLILG